MSVLLCHLRQTEPLRIVQWMLAYPILAMLLSAAGPVLLATIGLLRPLDVDTSLESFRIQNHPVAEIEVQ